MTGSAFSFRDFNRRPNFDFGLIALGCIARVLGVTPATMATGCAFPNVHMEDNSDEANVRTEWLDMTDCPRGRSEAFFSEESAESMKEVSLRFGMLVSISSGFLRRLWVLGVRWGVPSTSWGCNVWEEGISVGEGGGALTNEGVTWDIADEAGDSEVEKKDTGVLWRGDSVRAYGLWTLVACTGSGIWIALGKTKLTRGLLGGWSSGLMSDFFFWCLFDDGVCSGAISPFWTFEGGIIPESFVVFVDNVYALAGFGRGAAGTSTGCPDSVDGPL